MIGEPIMTRKEAMDYANLDWRAIKMLIDSGELHDIGVPGDPRFARVELNKIMANLYMIEYFNVMPNDQREAELDFFNGNLDAHLPGTVKEKDPIDALTERAAEPGMGAYIVEVMKKFSRGGGGIDSQKYKQAVESGSFPPPPG